MTELSWLSGYLDPDLLRNSEDEAHRRLVYSALGVSRNRQLSDELNFSSEALQLLLYDRLESSRTEEATRELCSRVFDLARVQISFDDDLRSRREALRVACIGWLADKAPIAAKLLVGWTLPVPVQQSASWAERVTSSLIDAWLLLLRKQSWSDIDVLIQLVAELRQQQQDYERAYLEEQGEAAHPAAWELVALYHLSRSAEILGTYLTQGQTDRRYDPRQQVEAHFDRALNASSLAKAVELYDLAKLLSFVAEQLLDNSIWTVARAAGPSTTSFVENVVSRGRKAPIFEVLAPQRQALSEEGLARAAQRSVVVSLPTSSGKTLIAQFRILQALSLFDAVNGWVAYVAPTRALVNQITSRFRRDFGPLGIVVERVSPALEIDGLEAGILTDSTPGSQFRVLVTTPEKLDLLLRGGWEEEIGRPLCLVVVDEAHNLSSARRGMKLELLLATINRESRDAQFLLLTPFIENSKQIAEWLDPTSSQSVELKLDWQPNDRVVCLSHREKGSQRGDYHIAIETLTTSRQTLDIEEELELGGLRPLGYTWSAAAGPNRLAAATSSVLESRGATITLTQQPSYAWTVAQELLSGRQGMTPADPDVAVVQRMIAYEFGPDFPLVQLLGHGIGVHHSGLSDDIRVLTEYLLENDKIRHLVATTTVAQGVNFPVSNVVFATHQYPYGEVMPPSDFWNIAGRAGRVDQGQTGVIVLAAPDRDRADVLRNFVNTNVVALNSTLVDMVRAAISRYGELNLKSLSVQAEWSAFVQFLAHTYRIVGSHEEFVAEVEQVLRGTLGFQMLRSTSTSWANRLVVSVREYANGLSGQPLSLVDSTGFSWESVSAALGRLADAQITPDVWESSLFGESKERLRRLIGVMLQVPELHDSLLDATGQRTDQGDFLANVVHDWVNGVSLSALASEYFSDGAGGSLGAMTRCCQRIYSDIAPTVAWGLSALQSLSLRGVFDSLSEQEQRQLRNLPAYAFYGVRTEKAVAMRLLGVPRSAAEPVAGVVSPDSTAASDRVSANLSDLRRKLRTTTADTWVEALGDRGGDYYRAWQILEGTI